MVMSWIRQKKPSVIGIATGAIAGLAAITPAAGFVGPMAAVVIGFVIGIVSFFAIEFKNKMGFDDALDVWAVHGVGGIWGALALGLFANAAINGVDGLFFGNANQLLAQAFGIGVVCVYSVVVTFVILKVLDWTMGLRVNEKDEEAGLDISQHGERIP
jgi:Amt family ammonium transporter